MSAPRSPTHASSAHSAAAALHRDHGPSRNVDAAGGRRGVLGEQDGGDLPHVGPGVHGEPPRAGLLHGLWS